MDDMTPLSLINKITLEVIEAKESLCEVSGWLGGLGVGGWGGRYTLNCLPVSQAQRGIAL